MSRDSYSTSPVASTLASRSPSASPALSYTTLVSPYYNKAVNPPICDEDDPLKPFDRFFDHRWSVLFPQYTSNPPSLRPTQTNTLGEIRDVTLQDTVPFDVGTLPSPYPAASWDFAAQKPVPPAQLRHWDIRDPYQSRPSRPYKLAPQKPPKGGRVYRCDECPLTFKKQSTWKQHKLVHSGAKPHLCDYCNVGFPNRSNRKRHYTTCKAAKKARDAAGFSSTSNVTSPNSSIGSRY